MKKIIAILILVFGIQLLLPACKAKRCASFEGQDKEYKLRYDRNGRVKK